MKSADEAATDAAQHLVATFDTLENAQSFAYKLRNKSWSGKTFFITEYISSFYAYLE